MLYLQARKGKFFYALLLSSILFFLPEGSVLASNEGDIEQVSLPWYTVMPFIILLACIATGPIFYTKMWHKNYAKISIFLASIVVLYYLIVLDNVNSSIHALFEYFQFIALIGSLYIATGSILIQMNFRATPKVNTIILAIGAIIANLIGTTGASMLLIRPFIRINKGRIKAYHIVFFIFIVSNMGGSLTPIGDPPLFIGFLKGVPFTWTIENLFLQWIVGISLCVSIFYIYDSYMLKKAKTSITLTDEEKVYSGIKIKGKRNFIWVAGIVGAVFLDPNVPFFKWLPAFEYHGNRFSYVRECIMIALCLASYISTKKDILLSNKFSFEPIREVAFLFIGIFGTMIPALEKIGDFASSEAGRSFMTEDYLYWMTGILSGFLDNMPTYLNFLTAAISSQGGDIHKVQDVVNFSKQNGFIDSIIQLSAISIASVFFGAMTYIGNGPNFMVKSIADNSNIRMPSFFGYAIKYSIPILFPILFIIWLLFY